MAPRRPGDRWKCTCGAELVGALTIRGSVAPISLEAVDNGNVWLGRGKDGEVRCAVLAGPLLDKARETGMALYLNHFADCPDAGAFR